MSVLHFGHPVGLRWTLHGEQGGFKLEVDPVHREGAGSASWLGKTNGWSAGLQQDYRMPVSCYAGIIMLILLQLYLLTSTLNRSQRSVGGACKVL